jgi:hypothetical protein
MEKETLDLINEIIHNNFYECWCCNCTKHMDENMKKLGGKLGVEMKAFGNGSCRCEVDCGYSFKEDETNELAVELKELFKLSDGVGGCTMEGELGSVVMKMNRIARLFHDENYNRTVRVVFDTDYDVPQFENVKGNSQATAGRKRGN